jgi:excisionase family DNA binding protein
MIGPLYDITQAAAILNVPRTWLRDKVTARAVPHTRIGRHVRFTEAHLVAIIEHGQKTAPTPAEDSRGPVPTGRRRRRDAA